jgi:hypothetical protein
MKQNQNCTELLGAQDITKDTAGQIKETAVPTHCRQKTEFLQRTTKFKIMKKDMLECAKIYKKDR